jgi:AraC-like DNA-binding protein
VSIRTVNRVFGDTGQTVGEVVRVRRLARARDDLTDTDRPISVIAHGGIFRTPATSAVPSKPTTEAHRRTTATHVASTAVVVTL